MKRIAPWALSLIVLAGAAGAPGFAQATQGAAGAQGPDLSGTWKLNRPSSQITTGVGLAGLGAGGAPNSLYITQAANGSLTVGSDHNQGFARAYMVGGESAIPTGQALNTTKVRTRWEGRTLVVEGTAAPAGSLKEMLSLSTDGQSLTVVVTMQAAEGAKTTTLLYGKTPVESPCKSWPTPCRN